MHESWQVTVLQFFIEVVLSILLEISSNHSDSPQIFYESLQVILQPLQFSTNFSI